MIANIKEQTTQEAKNIKPAYPPVKSTMPPELIVTVDKKTNNLPVLAVRKGDSTLMGVLPDTDSKAWFVLPAAGEYTFTHNNQTTTMNLKEVSSTQPPGYGYIDQLNLTPKK